jgi:hypothetical protein
MKPGNEDLYIQIDCNHSWYFEASILCYPENELKINNFWENIKRKYIILSEHIIIVQNGSDIGPFTIFYLKQKREQEIVNFTANEIVPSTNLIGGCLQLGLDHFLPYPFKFIIC